MNLEILESRTLLAGDMEAQEAEVDIEEQACSLSNPKTCSLLEIANAIALKIVIPPFVLADDAGVETAKKPLYDINSEIPEDLSEIRVPRLEIPEDLSEIPEYFFIEIPEYRALLEGFAQTKVDIEEEACSLSNLKACSLLEQASATALNAVISPFILVYDLGAETTNLVTELSGLAIDTAMCTLSPSEESCIPHRDLNVDLVKMISGTASALAATHFATTCFATKQLQKEDFRAAAITGEIMLAVGQATDVYKKLHGGKSSIQRVANSLKELKSYFSDESSTPINA